MASWHENTCENLLRNMILVLGWAVDISCKKVWPDICVWKWHLIRYCAMIWQYLDSLIPVLFFFTSTFHIDSIYSPYWVSLRSMSELSYRLCTLPDRAWISPPSSTELIVCDWQLHDANACNMLRICELRNIFKSIHQCVDQKKTVVPMTENYSANKKRLFVSINHLHL